MWNPTFPKRVALKIVHYKIHQSLDFNESSHWVYQNIKSSSKDRRNPPLDGAAEVDIDSKDLVFIDDVVDSGLYNHQFDFLLDGGGGGG